MFVSSRLLVNLISLVACVPLSASASESQNDPPSSAPTDRGPTTEIWFPLELPSDAATFAPPPEKPAGTAPSVTGARSDDVPWEFIPEVTGPADDGPAIVVTTPRRIDTWMFDAPYSVDVIVEERIRERMVRTLPEAMSEFPGVMVQKTTHGQGSPFIRGFTGYRNLLLIDGIRLNNSVFRSGPNQYWNTVDAYGLSSLELVKGQGSVLYGSDAIGGTVQAFSVSPPEIAEGSVAAGLVFGRYSTAEDSYIGRVQAATSEAGRYGMSLGFTGKSFGDLQVADLGELPNTGYDEWDLDFKLQLHLSERTILTLAHQEVRQDDIWRTHPTVKSRSWEGTDVGSEQSRILDQTRILSYAQLEGRPDSRWVDGYRASFSHQRQSEDRNRVRADGRRDTQGFDVDSFGWWAQFEKGSRFGDFVFGADYYLDLVSSFRSEFGADGTLERTGVQGPVGDNARYHLLGAFINDSVEVCDRLEMELGARYTWARADIGKVQDLQTGEAFSIADDWHNLSASARFLFNIDDAPATAIFGGLSQAFRAPNISDLSRFDSARSSEIETPSPGLDAEKFLTAEIGVRRASENFRVEASYYYTIMNDLIARAPTGRILDGDFEVTQRNSGDGYVHGVGLMADWEFMPGWSLFGNFSWLSGSLDGFPNSDPVLRREPLSRLQPVTGMVGLRWESPGARHWLEGLVTMAGRQDRLNAQDRLDLQRIPPGGTPGYTIFTVRGGWRIHEHFLATAAVENVTDEAYRVHGSGLNEPGINLVVGAEISF